MDYIASLAQYAALTPAQRGALATEIKRTNHLDGDVLPPGRYTFPDEYAADLKLGIPVAFDPARVKQGARVFQERARNRLELLQGERVQEKLRHRD